ncbi:MAG TPA: LysR substrate-binding domain-containing protein [Luteimonas sp.]|nr:LysR substrate-binding domain-containing protein [Luteimonas sp.]
MSRDLNDTLVFVKVVELGSFVGAARALRLPKTTVSRKVQELENRLGAQLLHRTTRKLGLTEAGNIYFEHCQRIARDLDEAESAVSQLQDGPRGWLRFTAPYSAGVIWIAPLLAEFRERHPEVRVEMILTNDKLDLIDKEIDIALRIGPLEDSNLVARRLGQFRSQVFASTGYLERHGEPAHPDELLQHRTMAFPKFRRNGSYYWPLHDGEREHEFRVDPVIVANDPSGLTDPLLHGEGLMLFSELSAKPWVERNLVRRVLPAWTGPVLDFNALFPRGLAQSPKIRAFVDFLVERLRFEADFMRVACPDSFACQHKAAELADGVAAQQAREATRRAMAATGAGTAEPEPVEAESEAA